MAKDKNTKAAVSAVAAGDMAAAADAIAAGMKQDGLLLKPKPRAAASVLRLDVTLVQREQNVWDVLDTHGNLLKCKCDRPIQASLHNVSVTERLGPCAVVVPRKANE